MMNAIKEIDKCNEQMSILPRCTTPVSCNMEFRSPSAPVIRPFSPVVVLRVGIYVGDPLPSAK